MNNRQRKKIINSYFMDAETELLIPPSVIRHFDRSMEIFDSKSYRISHPEEAAERDAAIAEAIAAAQAEDKE